MSNGRVLVNRRKPFEMFLKISPHGVFLFHLELHRLCVTVDPKKRWREPVVFRRREGFSWFFVRLWRVVVTADRRMKL